MDLSDLTLQAGTLPKSGGFAVAASAFCLLETSRTMTSLLGTDRFSLPYGGELIGATYSGVLGILASVVTKSPLPALAAFLSIAFFIGLYRWQEEKARE